MSDTRKEVSEKKMLDRMAKGEFHYRDLWMMFPLDEDGNRPEYREADRLIQREKKAGRIKQIRHAVWVKVEAKS